MDNSYTPCRQQQTSGSNRLTCICTAGAWLIHPILIFCLKILFDIVPGITQEVSWTLTNITYMAGSYIMFHWVRGIPFDFNSGAYDNLNMWEQIDNEQQFTPTKKYLLSVPIVLFLVSTHYTHYAIGLFSLNLLATIAVVIPKLPAVSAHVSMDLPRLSKTNFILPSCTDYEQRSFQARPKTGSHRCLQPPRINVIPLSPPKLHRGFLSSLFDTKGKGT
jgi:hypothetical protein